MGAAASLAWWLVVAPAPAPAREAAEDPGLELRWEGEGGCEDPEALRGALRGYQLEPAHERIAVGIDVQPEDGGWAVRLDMDLADEGVERSFWAESCELAIEAAALMIAVTLDPVGVYGELDDTEAATAEREAPEAEEPEVETLEVEAPEVEAPEPSPESPPSRVGFVATLAARGALGPLPGINGELFGSAGARVGLARVELTGMVGLPRERAVDIPGTTSGGDARVRLFGWAAGARGCGEPRLARAPVFFPLCLGVELGPQTVQGLGLPVERRSRALWSAVNAAASLSWMASPSVGVFAGVEGWLGLSRPRTLVDGAGLVHATPLAGVRALVGVEFRWPGVAANNPGGRRPRK